ncbi:putative NADH dehydrogenase [ubiquinone] 1 alpha subcomplex subunit 12 [Lycorma delicatula]|uniref:putative NADH dehydrogenase [ubiquinone] 1 alpha subcomplex subunit 12 n=1 Tax=Lycorma delicatula TaxID=130591 RepID=UPI003F50EFE3
MPLTKLRKFFEIIKVNGGIRNSLYKIFMRDDLKEGRLVGKDEFGNHYFENNRYFMGRSRWVEFNNNYKLEYDATHITPDWFGWMHYKTDLLPCEDPGRKFYSWALPHKENMSGTKYAYYPYSTTNPKITAWVPPKRCYQKKKLKK